jgi:hypothetical protein
MPGASPRARELSCGVERRAEDLRPHPPEGLASHGADSVRYLRWGSGPYPVPPPTGHGAPRALQLDHPGPPRRRPPRAPTGCETLWKPVPWHRAIPGARRPRHDWASHAADALRYLAQGIPGVAAPSPGRPVRVPMPAYDFTAPARRLIGLGPGSELL